MTPGTGRGFVEEFILLSARMDKVIVYQKPFWESQCPETSEIQYHYWFCSVGQK